MASGGGICNSGILTVTNSTLSNNSADGSGGGIDNSGTLTVFGSNISDNAADEVFGLRGSSPGSGGGIYNSGTLTVSGSTLSGNVAEGGGGDTFGLGAIGGSGGGIFNSGTLTVTNSTLSANAANVVSIDGDGPGSIGGSGGGIFDSGSLQIIYATIADNSVSGNSSRTGGGIAISKGPDTEVQSIDSIFKNLQGGNISGGSAGTFRSLGHNLFSNRPRVRLLHSDLINTNPLTRSAGQQRRADHDHGLAHRQSCHRRRCGSPWRRHRSTGRGPTTGECPRHRRIRVPERATLRHP